MKLNITKDIDSYKRYKKYGKKIKVGDGSRRKVLERFSIRISRFITPFAYKQNNLFNESEAVDCRIK